MKFLIGLFTFLVVVAGVALFLWLPWQGLLVLLVALALWLLLSRRGRQTASITAVGVSTMAQRLGSSAVIVIGIAGVVGVLVAMFAMAEGYRETLRRTGSEDTAIVMRGASSAEVSSVLDHDNTVVIAQAPGIAKDDKGKPIASPELVVAANLPMKGGNPEEDFGSVQLRGIGDEAWQLRPNAKIIAGRKFEPGKYELVAGKGAQRQFAGLEPGKEIKLGNQKWTVTGIFASNDAMDSELWGDAGVIGPAYRRGSSVTTVFARLTGPAAFDQFKAALTSDPRLQVDVTTTLDYFSKQSEGTSKAITVIGIVVGAIMAIGAVFGALNTMFAAIAARAREIATLRAIGFRGLPVVMAVMLETMLLALIGGALGGAIAWLIFNGYTASTLAAGTTGQLTFEFRVTPALLWVGLKWALAIGFIGGIYPALRAARLPVTTALREL
ncbi:putative ABC transport system permease protein [Dyella sp. OK004]|uniref:ABC transporter permease n=1 Tax=Dyella sp. OK004 TaxID=1855292 RepID=UPI0008DEDD15|nr:ABC transporter permease [Dyella sp. OK004]SFR90652.1 putative ABC transport system permease protein [Dyella sp. OK004]